MTANPADAARPADERVADLLARQEAARVIAPPAHGRTAFSQPPVREYIAELLDNGSFDEIGTLAHSDRREHAAATPGDGKVGGHGRIAAGR